MCGLGIILFPKVSNSKKVLKFWVKILENIKKSYPNLSCFSTDPTKT
jgi:hypothetical protein